MEQDRSKRLNHLTKQVRIFELEVALQVEKTKEILKQLIEVADEEGVFPSESFVYNGSISSKNSDIRDENAMILGEDINPSTSRKSKVVLKEDSSIVHSDYKTLYTPDRTKLPLRYHKVRTTSVGVRLDARLQRNIEGTDYVKWGLIAATRLSALISKE